jgi:formylmethanofuran dehydrogenase subunit E
MWEIEVGGKTIRISVDGWMCEECQQLECERCGEMTTHYEFVDGDSVCVDCLEEGEDDD